MLNWLPDVFQKILWNKIWISWVWACKENRALQPLFSSVVKSEQCCQSQTNPCTLDLCFYFEYQVWELSGNQSAFYNNLRNRHVDNQYHDSWIQSAHFQDRVSNQFQPVCMKSVALNSPPWSSSACKKFQYAIFAAPWCLFDHRAMLQKVGIVILFWQVFQSVEKWTKKEEIRYRRKPGSLTSADKFVSRNFWCSDYEAEYTFGVMRAPADWGRAYSVVKEAG